MLCHLDTAQPYYMLLCIWRGVIPTLDDLKAFRKYGSITPGHPEYYKTPGVDMTTGPLGEGFASPSEWPSQNVIYITTMLETVSIQSVITRTYFVVTET